MGTGALWGMITARMGFRRMARLEDRLRLTQILSPAFPIGSFAHSQGLEYAIAEGGITTPGALEPWLRAVLTQGAGRMDVIFLALARADDADLVALGDLYHALQTSAGRARESVELAGGFATLMAALGAPVPQDLPYVLSVGQATRGLDIPTEDVLSLWLQGLAAQLISVAVRFMPMGQAQGQAMLAALAGDIAQLAGTAATATEADLFSFTPGADLASMRQEFMETRLYRS